MSCHAENGDRDLLTGTRDVALIGCPNAGKSSLFNRLTGLSATTGNYPGVTVTRSRGKARIDGADVTITDLPGTYSLSAASPDEQVVLDHIQGRLPGEGEFGSSLVVMDATTLERSMILFAHVFELGRPTAVVLTMVDELRAGGGDIDSARLSQALGVPVAEVVAHKGRGVDEVRELLGRAGDWPTAVVPPPTADRGETREWIDSVLATSGYRANRPNATTRGIDRILLHPVWGVAVFFLVMFLFFQTIFTVAAPAQGWIETLFAALGEWAGERIEQPLVADFVSTALVGGVGGVLVFLPQIALLYVLISILESVGYMSRAAFLMDRVMAHSGLDGRAFVAMLSSMACAVPGIMATRTMASSRDRIATILSAPLMTCSARLPVYVLLIAMLVPDDARFGPFGWQGTILFLMYVLGGLAALTVARVLKATILRRGSLPFYLEMPPYRIPTPRQIARAVWVPVWMFTRKVGTIILAATIALWALMSFPANTAATEGMDEPEASAYVLEHSIAGRIGHVIEPVFAPQGFDWRIDVGLLGSFAAREVFVSTMGQVVAADNADEPADALSAMTYTHGPNEGEKVFSAPTIAALLVFFAFAMQCVSTLATMRRETNSWKWPAVATAYMFVLAWVGSWLAAVIVRLVTGG
ncbi:ferrous iron transporter B [Kocuria sp. JC486]|uniref:ferrous iron transporter B n=1 Tax=Kocuria sp. JC486 TaxID=1970736 RepID=UPI0032AF954F